MVQLIPMVLEITLNCVHFLPMLEVITLDLFNFHLSKFFLFALHNNKPSGNMSLPTMTYKPSILTIPKVHCVLLSSLC